MFRSAAMLFLVFLHFSIYSFETITGPTNLDKLNAGIKEDCEAKNGTLSEWTRSSGDELYQDSKCEEKAISKFNQPPNSCLETIVVEFQCHEEYYDDYDDGWTKGPFKTLNCSEPISY